MSIVSNDFCVDVRQLDSHVYKNSRPWKSFQLFGENSCRYKRIVQVKRLVKTTSWFTKEHPHKCSGKWGHLVHDEDETQENVTTIPPYKYCKSFLSQPFRCKKYCTNIYKLAVLLPELHANLNIGHSVKDFIFLANVMTITTPDAIIVDDKAADTGNIYNIHLFDTDANSYGRLYLQRSKSCLHKRIQTQIYLTFINKELTIVLKKLSKSQWDSPVLKQGQKCSGHVFTIIVV